MDTVDMCFSMLDSLFFTTLMQSTWQHISQSRWRHISEELGPEIIFHFHETLFHNKKKSGLMLILIVKPIRTRFSQVNPMSNEVVQVCVKNFSLPNLKRLRHGKLDNRYEKFPLKLPWTLFISRIRRILLKAFT